MIRIFQLWQRTDAGWRQMPPVFYGIAERPLAREKLREYRAKYGDDNVVLRFVQLPR